MALQHRVERKTSLRLDLRRLEKPFADADCVSRGDRGVGGQGLGLLLVCSGALDEHLLFVRSIGETLGCGDGVQHGEPEQRGIIFLVHVSKRTTAAEFIAQRPFVPEKSLHFKGEVLGRAIVLDFDLGGLGAEFAVRGG